MEDWEKEMRERLDKELENKMYQIGEGEWVAFTGKQGFIDYEVGLEKLLRETMEELKKGKG